MILFSCSCGRRHPFLFPCNGVIDINSADVISDEASDIADALAYAKDVKEEIENGWTNPIEKRTRVEP